MSVTHLDPAVSRLLHDHALDDAEAPEIAREPATASRPVAGADDRRAHRSAPLTEPDDDVGETPSAASEAGGVFAAFTLPVPTQATRDLDRSPIGDHATDGDAPRRRMAIVARLRK